MERTTASVAQAVEACEAFTGQVLVARTIEERLPVKAGWQRLTGTPVRSIRVTNVAAADYTIDIDANGDGWVRIIASSPPEHVLVSYEAGLADTLEAAPESLRMGVERLASWLNEHGDQHELPSAVAALWRPWRRLRLS